MWFVLTCRSVSFCKNLNIVASQVKSMLKKASIPMVTPFKYLQLINAYNNSYRNLMKLFNRDKEKEQFKKRIEDL